MNFTVLTGRCSVLVSVNKKITGINIMKVNITEIHKTKGSGLRRFAPHEFFRSAGSHLLSEVYSKSGRYGGTFATKRVADEYVKWIEGRDTGINIRIMCERESGALSAIEQLLNITLERQYRVGKYRIDGYCIETNTAYEIDEAQHRKPSSIAKDNKRQAFIENELGCNFVRIKV